MRVTAGPRATDGDESTDESTVVTATQADEQAQRFPTDFPHVPSLDGVRGIAVAAVLLFHGEFAFASGGFLGVSTFFTLSGFLIASLLLTEEGRAGRIDLKRFWVRRFRRLMPAAVVAIGAIALISYTVPAIETTDSLPGDLLAALFYVANWRFIFSGLSYNDLFAQESPVQHFWSLAVEEQFYVFFPLLTAGVFSLARGQRRAFTVTIAVLLALSVSLGLAYDDVDRIYNGTDVRMAEILVGVLLAIAYATWTGRTVVGSWIGVQLLGLVGLAVSLAAWSLTEQTDDWLYNGGFALYAIGSAAVIAGAMQQGRPLATALAWRPMRWLGEVSYGAYLYHWPIFLWFDEDSVGLDGLALFIVRMAITLTVTWLSFHYLEQPIRRGVRPGSAVARPELAVAGALGVVLAGALVFGGVFDEDAPDADVAFEPTTTTEAPPATTDASPDGQPASTTSVPGSTTTVFVRDEAPVLTVIGDSIATDLQGGLERRAEALGDAPIVATDLAFPGCGLTVGGFVFLGDRGEVPACERTLDLVAERVGAEQPAVAVLSVGFVDLLPRKFTESDDFVPADDPAFVERVLGEYRALQDMLTSQGVAVLWVNAPCMSDDRAEEFRIPEGAVSALNDRVRDLAEASDTDAVGLFDLHGAVCPDGGFTETYTSNGETDPEGRSDGLHFSEFAANDLAVRIVDATLTLPSPAQ